MRLPAPVVAVPLLLLALAAVRGAEPEGTPDAELGLTRGSVFEIPLPDPVRVNDSAPGELPLLPRAYVGAPPVVPHGLADFLPITREDNLCVDCHGIAEAEEGDPTPIPASHYTDLRRAPGRVGESVAGARWVCVSCHVAPSGAEPLVVNVFAPPPAQSP